MKRFVSIVSLLFLTMAPLKVDAHITNEKTLYEDIAFSDAFEEIMHLRAMNAISAEEGVNLYRPKDLLKREVLAEWALNFTMQKDTHNEGNKEGVSPEKSVEEGLIDTIQGNATLDDVNKAFFNGTLSISDDKEITREEFALFMGEHFATKVDGKDFFERSGLSKGPSGTVDTVIPSKGSRSSTLSIDRKEYSLSDHPKILNGPSDEESLKGLNITDSYVRKDEQGKEVLDLVVIKSGDMAMNTGEKTEEATTDTTAKEDEKNSGNSLYYLSIPLIVILLWLASKPIVKKIKK